MGTICKISPLVGKVIPKLIKNLIIMPQIITNTAELSCNQGVLFFLKHKITNFRELLFYYKKKFKQLQIIFLKIVSLLFLIRMSIRISL